MEQSIRQLRTEYSRIVESHVCDVTDKDYESISEKIDNVKRLAELENRSISIYDLNRKAFLLKVDRHINLLGYADEETIDINNVNLYHEMVHSDDLPFLYDSEIKMHRYLSSIKGVDKKDYKLVYDYRVRCKNGSYLRFLHQIALFELDKFYNSWLLVVISDVISSYPTDERPRRFLINTKNNRVYLFNEEAGIKNYLITKREKEIVNLVAQGLDSKEIADNLCISSSTVNNHRQHVLQKTVTKSITQATMYLRCIGLV